MPSNEEIEAEKQRLLCIKNSDRCEALSKDENFQWFLEEVIAPIVKGEQKAATTSRNTPEQRNSHVHRFEMASEILDVFPQIRTFWANKAKPEEE